MKAPTGRRVVVTGGASGIGHAAAQRFASEGARVAIIDRDEEALAAAAPMFSGESHALLADVTDESQVERAFASLVDQWGGVDVLVANAAVQLYGRDSPVHELEKAVWDATIAVNLTGTFLTCKHGIRAILASGGGSVVVLASATSLYGLAPGFDAYSASKGGVLALARVMALDYASLGIRVNAVIPGPIATPLVRTLTDDTGAVEKLLQRVPLRRMGTPGDIAGMITFLASDDAAYATGGIFTIDGGMTAG
jgi:NAD(P)-dependent dehydrogenase (short-subunit alcohol dehydrogenase family)